MHEVVHADATDRWARWLNGWRLACAFLAVAVVTHLPSLLRTEVLNPDEAFLATEANVLNDGGRLYQDVVDRKPPIVPYLYAAVFKVAHTDSLLSTRLLAIVAHVVTALLVAAIARRRWGDRVAFAAGCLWLVASCGLVLEDSQPANFEVFMTPLMCAAMYFGIREREVGAGGMTALATLAKQTAAVTMLPLAWLAWRHDRTSGLIRLGVAFVLPIAAAALFFGWHDFFFWVFTGSGGYLDASGSWTVAVNRGLASSGIFLAANLAALLLLIGAGRRWREDVDLWLWLLSAIVAVAAGFRFFGHYYLQLGPPFALLAAGTLRDARPIVWARTAVLGVASIAVFLVLAFTAHPNILPPYDRIAAEIDAHTGPGDRVFVWGQFPQAYWASGRLPATRFLTAGFLTGFSGGRSAARVGMQYATPGAWDQFQQDVTEDPPAVILDTAVESVFPMRDYPIIDAYVKEHYEPPRRVEGALLYVRKPGP